MALLEYKLTAVGLADVERAYKTLEGYARQHNAAVRRIIGQDTMGGSPYRVATAARMAHVNPATEAEKMYGPARREFQKSVDYRIKQELKAEREVVRAHERAEKAKTRETQQEARKRERIIEAETRAEAHALEKRRQNRFQLGFGTGYGSMLGGAAKIGAVGMALTGLAGGAIVASAIHDQLKVGASASGLANQMVGAGSGPEEIAKQKAAIMATAAKVRGASSLDAIGSARAFGGISGNYDLGLKMAQDFTKISLATDVGLEDISRLAGNAYMKIKTPGMSEDEARKQTLEAVRTFAGQGNIGAVEIKDLAQYGGRLTAAAAQFKGSRVENMAKMGTLAQVAVGSGSATDAAEATMAAARFASDLTEHAKDVAKLTIGGKSINPFTDASKTQFRGIDTLVADIMQGTGGNMEKMKDIFGERSYKMAQGFQQIYLDAEKTQKGSGREAVMAKFAEFAKAAVDEKDVETRAAARLNDADMQLEMAFKDLKSTVGTAVMPAFNELVPAIKDFLPVVGDLLSVSKDLIGAFTSVVKFIEDQFGTKSSKDKQTAEAIAVANEGTLKSPYARLRAAEARLSRASGELNHQSFAEDAGALLTGEDTPTLKRYRQAEKDVRAAQQELKQYEKNTAATEANTKAMQALSDMLRVSTPSSGGGSGGAGAIPPRGANGTSQQPHSSEFWDY